MRKGFKVYTAFDEYVLDKQIGAGGNARVFSARSSSGEIVAVKFIEKNLASDKFKRFKNEIYFCECHKHKNIVEIMDKGYTVDKDTEYAFYVMPLYAETLRDKMKFKLTPEQAVKIFEGLIEGLYYVHKNGTIHRDVKPENIMFKEGSIDPILCDFGIAHFAEEDLVTMIETKQSDRLANFQYAAPEQRVKGGIAAAQTDIYAAALILNEMFTGEIPQAADYKTIASFYPDYKFLDDIFVQMFKQNAIDRLYPEDKILTEMKIRAELYKHEQEKLRLQKIVDEVVVPEEFVASVINKEFADGSLVFTLDQKIPHDWFSILLNRELGSYSALVGYEPDRLELHGMNAIGMPLHGLDSKNGIKAIVENVSDWVWKANRRYNENRKQVARKQQREKEVRRKAEIERLEKESEINRFLLEI